MKIKGRVVDLLDETAAITNGHRPHIKPPLGGDAIDYVYRYRVRNDASREKMAILPHSFTHAHLVCVTNCGISREIFFYDNSLTRPDRYVIADVPDVCRNRADGSHGRGRNR